MSDTFHIFRGRPEFHGTKDVTLDEDQRTKFSHSVRVMRWIFGGRYNNYRVPSFV